MGSACCISSNHEPEDLPRIDRLKNSSKIDTLGTYTNIQFKPEDLVLERKESINKFYQVIEPPLGEGISGKVYRAIHQGSGALRAIKIIKKKTLMLSEDEAGKIMNEIKLLKTLSHPHIIRIFEFYENKEYYNIVTDLCTGGELFDKITQTNSFSEKDVAHVMRQIMLAVSYCHSKSVVHGDLKPENVLFVTDAPGSSIKLIDFGSAKIFRPKEKLHYSFGTPYYVSPEVIMGEYTEKADIWSCGVILYMLLSGKPPFSGITDNEIYDKIMEGKFEMGSGRWDSVHPEAKDLIIKMLEYTPSKRISAAKVLKHPWFETMLRLSVDVNPKIYSQVLQNLKNYRAGRKLQQALWLFFVEEFSSKKDAEKLLNVFSSLDTDGDGKVTFKELLNGFEQVMGSTLSQEEAKELAEELGGESKQIDYTKFVLIAINKKKLFTKNKVDQAFKLFDQDSDGFISIEDFKKRFNLSDLEDGIWLRLMKDFDPNSQGRLSFRDFKLMIQGIMGKDANLKESIYQFEGTPGSYSLSLKHQALKESAY